MTKEASQVTNASVTVTSAVTSSAGSVALLDAAPAEGGYLTIAGTANAVDGSVTTNAKCVSTEGYITASTQTLPITEAVTVGVTNAVNKYIKIYAGEIVESTI